MDFGNPAILLKTRFYTSQRTNYRHLMLRHSSVMNILRPCNSSIRGTLLLNQMMVMVDDHWKAGMEKTESKIFTQDKEAIKIFHAANNFQPVFF